MRYQASDKFNFTALVSAFATDGWNYKCVHVFLLFVAKTHISLSMLPELDLHLLQLENLTLVSSDLQTKVAASKDKSEELLNKTLARDTNLPGTK